MKAQKWGCLLLLAALGLVFCVPSASASAVVRANYTTIVKSYEQSLIADSAEDALENLRALCRYYEEPGRAAGLEAYEGGTALLLYTYAKGMIAFSVQDYDTAWEDFEFLQGMQVSPGTLEVSPLPDTTYHYQFSMAMLYWRYGDYASAFDALETARTASGANATACRDAKADFGQQIKREAQACCDRGDHALAQEYYQLYTQNVNRFEGQSLLEKCRQHSQVVPLSVSRLESADPGRIVAEWSGSGASYRVSWSEDLTGAAAPESATVNGTRYEIAKGLLPGTAYRVTVEEIGGASVTKTVSTQAAPGYSSGRQPTWKVESFLLRRYERALYTKTSSLYSLYDFVTTLRPAPSARSVSIAALNDGSSGYALVMSTNQEAQAINALTGVAYTVVLHVGDLGAVASQGTMGDAKSSLTRNVLTFALDDVLDAAMARYALETETSCRVDFLADGALLGTYTTTIVPE